MEHVRFDIIDLTALPNPPANTVLLGRHTDGKWYAKLPSGDLEPMGGVVSGVPDPAEFTYYSSGSIKIKKEEPDTGVYLESRFQFAAIILEITKTGYQDHKTILNYPNNRKTKYFVKLNPIVTVISVKKGLALNLNPKDNQNKIFG